MEDTNGSTKKKSGTEKKRKAPKAPTIESESIDDVQTAPVKSKKNRAPKIEVDDEPIVLEEPVKKKKSAPKIAVDDEPIVLEEPVKKKKSKAPKALPIEDDFQIVEAPTIDELEAPIEQKPKTKKSKKPKKSISQSLDGQQYVNGDLNPENYIDPSYADGLPPSENDSSEYERAILDAYSNLASQINFAEYVGGDQWCIIHLPKTARTEPKSRIRKMLPGGSKDEKIAGKPPPVPKGSLLTRFRNGMNLLVRDEKNLLFGERSDYDFVGDDDADGVDTDDLHRYAQKLRELEDQDREVNPEFLVLRDGKTVYGVHESDADGKIKLSTRKPIYDRQADQKPDELTGKKKIMAYFKMPFGRNKEAKDTKSANTTPDTRIGRKSSRKSLTDITATTINDEPLNI